jgi:hypothetical protein
MNGAHYIVQAGQVWSGKNDIVRKNIDSQALLFDSLQRFSFTVKQSSGAFVVSHGRRGRGYDDIGMNVGMRKLIQCTAKLLLKS